MKQSIAKYIAVVIILFFAFGNQLFAQGPGGPAPGPAPPAIPIDGGVIGLLLVGLGYGARKLYMQGGNEDATK